MFGVGVDPLGEVLAAVRSLVAGFEVDGLDAPEAARVVGRGAEAERLLAGVRGAAATTVGDQGLVGGGGGSAGGGSPPAGRRGPAPGGLGAPATTSAG